jgi:hypothetical protein
MIIGLSVASCVLGSVLVRPRQARIAATLPGFVVGECRPDVHQGSAQVEQVGASASNASFTYREMLGAFTSLAALAACAATGEIVPRPRRRAPASPHPTAGAWPAQGSATANR